jgi:sarcosine oxidase subunit gamma
MIPKVSASMLEHHEPFDSLLEAPGGALAEDPDLRVTPLGGVGFLLLQSTSESTLQDALTSETGLRLPAPQEASVRGDHALLWLTPAEWLLRAPANEINSLESALSGRLATSLAVVTDVSDAFACCEVSGARAAEALMSGCSLDLSIHSFPLGRVARTALADIPAVIWNPGREPQRFRCIVDCSYARHLRDWLHDVTRSQGAFSAQ